ncbi:MAG: citryl-CoA lyase [Alphaproteobacteria bacterium]|nr:citryl-CoA lyase [Alphaproteobacteria bacterium]MDE2163026.1 citryl-CoA lyase [Alphaproteobacteria bacterium]MDE2499106.1 citryl-CoA lyase [Alphaproteobacteria bacterium]
MTKPTPEELVDKATAWWTTKIIDVQPGAIGLRGYAVQDLLGKVTFPEMIWLMLRGDLPSPGQAKLLEAAMVASVDHGPHAPSIAIARMAVTCGTDINGAMASAVNVLADIHGGPAQQCMMLFEMIASELDRMENLPAVVDDALDRYIAGHGKIIPGFGHRFHPIDPRAEPLLGLVDGAAADGIVSGRFAAIARGVVAGIHRRTGKNIPMNIDGATAAIFCELGFAPQLGRGLFILSRSVGILAHAWEQMLQGGRIKGPMPKEIPYTYAGPAPRKLERGEK